MSKTSWYVELWQPDGRAAEWWRNVKSFSEVIAIIHETRQRGQHEIIRVGAPLTASHEELTQLEKLGARRF